MLAEALRIVQRETRLRGPQFCGLMGIDKNAFYRIRHGHASRVAITQKYLWQRLLRFAAISGWGASRYRRLPALPPRTGKSAFRLLRTYHLASQ